MFWTLGDAKKDIVYLVNERKLCFKFEAVLGHGNSEPRYPGDYNHKKVPKEVFSCYRIW